MTTNAPLISVALLIRNGMPKLAQLLAALRSQELGGEFEIVAVDSGSTDGSCEALADAGARVTQIDPGTFRFGPTRQLAFSLTRGQVIVTMSQDTVPAAPNWLRSMTEPILNDEYDIVQAVETAPQSVGKKLYLHQLGNVYKHWPSPYNRISCAGMAISRKAWDQTGFGDVSMSEDKYLGAQAMKLGLRMGFSNGPPLAHGHEYTPLSLAKRAFNEGMGARTTSGYYSFGDMLRDLTRTGLYRYALAAILKHRTMKPSEAFCFPLRPVFLQIGFRFGRRYWR
jgi:hypothetical protein